MLYQVVCPHCNTNMQTDSAWVGQQLICPSCQKTFCAPPPPDAVIPQGYENDENACYQNSTGNPVNVIMILLLVIGYGLWIFSVIDFCGMFFDYDLTGFRWSPLVLSVIGSIFVNLAGRTD